ncbi:MAG: iron-containing alcohol dehydrogenase [Synergistaceae bacterium]|nr:iron-containing alcohol dehydrogenase [Synergistaceae bacterium]
MLDFEFYAPTRVLFGRNAITFLPAMLAKYGAKKVMLLHYGESSPEIPMRETRDKLREAPVSYTEFTGIKPNPVLSCVLEGIRFARDENFDFLLAVGGASVIDTAKAIAAGVRLPEGHDIWEDYFFHKTRFSDALPIGVVLTIPAAGSETSFGTCLTNEKIQSKRYTGGEALIPKFAIMNPEYSMTLSPYQTGCGVCDIVAHLVERYFVNFENEDLSDRMIEACIRSLLINGPILAKYPNDYAARAEVMWAGSIAHNKILEAGRTHGDWASHDIGHELSGFYDLAHGASLAIVMPAWMKYIYKHNKSKFSQFARRVFDVDIAFDKEDNVILEMISRFENFCRVMGMPTRMSEAGIDKSKFEQMAESAMKGRKHVGTGNGIVLLGYKEILDIYNLAS